MIIMIHSCLTLVVIMISVVVIGPLIAGAAGYSYLRNLNKARYNICLKNRGTIEKAEVLYVMNKGERSSSIQDLVDAGYLKRYPECPSGGIYAWNSESQDSEKANFILGCSIHGFSDPLPVEDDSLLDDFEGSYSGSWTETGKWWKVKKGKYYGGREKWSAGENRTFFGDEEWTDYTVELDANLIKGGPTAYGYGVYFRAQDYSNLDSYIFQYDPGWGSNGSFLFRKVVDGREQPPFAVESAPDGYEWNDVEKHIKVDVSGDTFSAYVEDIDGGEIPVVTGSDNSFSTGSIGLRTWNNAYASFDNVSVDSK